MGYAKFLTSNSKHDTHAYILVIEIKNSSILIFERFPIFPFS